MLLNRLPFFNQLQAWPLFVVAYTVAWIVFLTYVWFSWNTFSMEFKVTATIILVLTTPAIADLKRLRKRKDESNGV